MKVGKTLQTLLSFFIAFAMVFPGAVKVEAADHPYSYDVQNTIILDADITGISTNNHTYAKAFWTYGANVYLMIESTHDAKVVELYNSAGSIVSSTDLTAYPPGDTVTIDKTYAPTETSGNTKDSHLTVFMFPLSEILTKLGVNGGSYLIKVESEQGKGHWIYGTLTIHIPKAEVKVTKTWQDGPKDDVSIQLYRKLKDADDSTYVSFGDPFTLTSANPMKTISNLNFTDNIGRIYTYTAMEVNLGEGYESSVVVTGPTLVNRVQVFTIAIKNTYTPPMTDIEVTKVWKDGDDPSARPPSLTYYLYADGGTVPVRTGTADSSNWNYTFKDLPKTQLNGTAITYTVKEAPVPGYSTSIDGLVVTNVRSEKRDVDVEKLWKDGDDPSGRPSSVTFNLLANGTKVDSVVLTATKSWKHTFKDLEKFDAEGKMISYTVTEETVTGYTPTIDGLTITNLRTGLVDIEGKKTWFDEDEESRPEFITVVLMRNGKEVDQVDVKEEEGLWTYSFTELPEFDGKGVAYVYKIAELPVDGYKTIILGYDIKNVRTGLVDVNGEKTWDDLMRRPESVTVNLLQNGVEIDDVSVTKDAEGKWRYSFTELPEFDEDGIAYVYSVTEDALAGYKPTVTGYNIMNRQLRGTLDILKIDDFNAPVKDVTFEIDDTNGVLIYRGSTDKDGILKIILPLGTYIVRETYAPEDYIMDDKEKTITIDEDGETVKLTVVNIKEFEDVGPLPDTGGKPKPALPKTGAESSFIWYGMGAVLALAGFTLLKKKKTTR